MKKLIALLALTLSALAHADTVDWPLSYDGKSTNAFIWDKRAKPLIQTRVPAKLSKDVIDGLGGPPDPVFVVEKRYVSVSACVAHACPEKGFFWIDTQTGQGLGADIYDGALRLGSNSLSPAQIPAAARRALIDWTSANDITVTSVEFIDRTGTSASIDAAQFKPAPHFEPAAGGPSYDCKAAATHVEKTICADPALASQDLAMAKHVRELRQGYATIGDRNLLRDFQRKWLKERDATCAAAADINGCLARQYQTQDDRLRNWTPAQ
ncbi:lysozyme inhibitor LprI family protein [Rugamonas sp. A1-17]|nr:lysozyme inhibitor LprI family protein [Rugamonas sp. A1-17]